MTDYYHFQGRGVARRSVQPHDQKQARLQSDARVHWSKQQRAKSRQKRDFIPLKSPRALVPQRVISATLLLNDQYWPQMWYLNRGQGLDMNVIPAWEEGITGKGIVVTILDDGLEKDHPDLIRNYDPLASFDVNSHDEDPMPRYDMIDSNRHGTRCAGEVAATANNSLCAVGVAFGASVGGVRMLDGDVTDAVEARSLSLNPQHIDIYSASWGPDDDGKTVDGPGELATRAFMEGVTKGRNGKGSIFVWASGNGGRDHDNCNCDGYTNSIWTLSISSATETGHVPWYSEACSSTLATTYSSGSSGEKQVVTTDLHHDCTPAHTGTSASAPLAAGICALALEANSALTWRDMQHIVVRTARPANLNAPDWQVNGVGRNVSHSFGYGLMDAHAMVQMARNWTTVPEQQKCEISAHILDSTIPPKSKRKFSLTVKECPGVNYLEHVQAKITLTTYRRGDLQINLTSPAGTRCTLLAYRSNDLSRQGFVMWPFMSVHTWGEQPFGEWKLEIHNEGRTLNRASLQQWSLIMYGTNVSVDRINDKLNTLTKNRVKLKTPINPIPFGMKKGKMKGKVKAKLTPFQQTTTKVDLAVIKGISRPKIYKPPLANFQLTTESPRRNKLKKNQKSTKAFVTLSTTFIPPYKLANYHKIQQVYPALYPVKGSDDEKLLILHSIDLRKDNNRLKMSRNDFGEMKEHRKDKKYTHESDELAGTRRTMPGKKHESRKSNGSNMATTLSSAMVEALSTTSRQTTATTSSFSSKNEADLTDWNLVLHGTPTLPGDNPRTAKRPQATADLPVEVQDLDHNSIEHEPTWNDYAKVIKLKSSSTLDEDDDKPMSDNVTSGTGCVKSTNTFCLECNSTWILHEGKCLRECPPSYFAETITTKALTVTKICQRCHYTCLKCFGPNDYECSSCYIDAALYSSKSESHCYTDTILAKMHAAKWIYRLYIPLLVLFFIFLLAIVAFFLVCLYLRCRKKKDSVYAKIDLNGHKYKFEIVSDGRNEANESDSS